jgi:hypothetical protein
MASAGHLRSVQGLKRRLAELPKTMAAEVAKRITPEMTKLARGSFNAGQNVYGDARKTSRVDGSPLDLYDTGRIYDGLQFKAFGTITRCVLGPKYAKYVVGRYKTLPNGPLPFMWTRKIADVIAALKPAGFQQGTSSKRAA